MFLIARGYDVRDVCANRTPRSDRGRQRGKSDALDSERIAREVLAHPLLPKGVQARWQRTGPCTAPAAAGAVAQPAALNPRQPSALGGRGRAHVVRAAVGAF